MRRPQRGGSVLGKRPTGNRGKTAKCLDSLQKIGLGEICPGKHHAYHGAGANRGGLDVEALAAATLALGFGVLKLEGLIQALFDEIDHSAVDQRQAARVDDNLDAALLEHRIVRLDGIGIVDHVGKAGTDRKSVV